MSSSCGTSDVQRIKLISNTILILEPTVHATPSWKSNANSKHLTKAVTKNKTWPVPLCYSVDFRLELNNVRGAAKTQPVCISWQRNYKGKFFSGTQTVMKLIVFRAALVTAAIQLHSDASAWKLRHHRNIRQRCWGCAHLSHTVWHIEDTREGLCIFSVLLSCVIIK